MANRSQYKSKIVPFEQLTTSDATVKNTLASEVLKKLGGSGTSMQDRNPFDGDVELQGVTGKAFYYVPAPYTASAQFSNNIHSSAVMLVNTGSEYSSSSELGDALDLTLKVTAGPNDAIVIAELEPGGAVMLPCNTGANIDCREIFVQTVDHDGTATTTGNLAVKFFVGNAFSIRDAGMISSFELNIIGSGN